MFGLDSVVLRIIGIATAVVAVFGFGYYKGYSGEKERFDSYKAEINALAVAQQNKIEMLQKTQSQITKKAEADHEKSISNIRGVYSTLRVRQSTGSCGMSQVPDATKQPAETTAYYVSIAPELATGCAETTQQLINLQNWVQQQSELQ